MPSPPRRHERRKAPLAPLHPPPAHQTRSPAVPDSAPPDEYPWPLDNQRGHRTRSWGSRHSAHPVHPPPLPAIRQPPDRRPDHAVKRSCQKQVPPLTRCCVNGRSPSPVLARRRCSRDGHGAVEYTRRSPAPPIVPSHLHTALCRPPLHVYRPAPPHSLAAVPSHEHKETPHKSA